MNRKSNPVTWRERLIWLVIVAAIVLLVGSGYRCPVEPDAVLVVCVRSCDPLIANPGR